VQTLLKLQFRTEAPGKISIITILPFRRRVGSPAAMAGRP
jgi:hypothetical protein